jgi:hypothetical protein
MKDKKKIGKGGEAEPESEPFPSASDKAPRNRKTKDLFRFDEAFDVWDSSNPREGEGKKESEENNGEESKVNLEENPKNSSPKNKLSAIASSATKFKALEKFVKSARKNLSKTFIILKFRESS